MKEKHMSTINRVNSGKPRTGNPEPSIEIAKRLNEGAETRVEETIIPTSALENEYSQEIVRHFKGLEITDDMATTQHLKEV